MPYSGSAGYGHALRHRSHRIRQRARAFGVAFGLIAIVSATGAAPATAAPLAIRPAVTVSTRAGATQRATATRVDVGAAARAAATESRAMRIAPRLRPNLGAKRGAAKQPSTITTKFNGSPSGGSIKPRVVSGTLEPQVVLDVPGIEQADTCACEPPDPWVAVGPSHVVQSTNGKIRISNRLGTQLVSMPAWALFAVPANRYDSDPRIIWDNVHARWLGIITSFTGDFLDNGLRFAISDTSDPTGGWTVYAIDTGPFLPDYPGISSSSTKVVLSSDDFWDDPEDLPDLGFGVFAGPSLYVMDWSALLGSGSIFLGGYFEGPTRAHFRPAQMLSSGSSVPVIFEEMSGDVGYLDVTQTAAGISAIDPGTISAFDLSSGGPGLAQFIAPVTQPTQPGPDPISGAADERPTDAVYRNGHLWFVATTDTFDGVDHWASARWTEILTSVNNVMPTNAGDWITPFQTHFFNPGVTISGNGTAFFLASVTDELTFPTTLVGTVVPNGSNLGVDFLGFDEIGTSTEAYAGSRWGDYLGVAADPLYSGSAWVEHELVSQGGGWRTNLTRIASDATAPTIPGVITQAIVTGSTQTGTVPVKVSWAPAVDVGTGIGSYLVERSDGGGPFVGVTTTGTSVTQPLILGVSVQYRVTPLDLLGNVGPARTGAKYTPSLFQSNTASTVYTTGWGTSSSTSFSGGSTKYSSTAGKYATFTMTNARSIAIVATKAASRGSFKVYVDGVYRGTISTYSTTTKYRQLVYQFAWSAPGTHKVKVVIVGTAGHPRVDLDAFVVLR
jgi:hypothetical protein